MHKKFSVVIPVFKSEKYLPNVFACLDVLRGELKTRDVDLQAIFVDDGSPDASFGLLRRRHAEHGDIHVVKLTRNFGAIPALKSTFQFIDGDAFIFLAADLQDSPTLIPRMVDLWLGGEKYVIARRKQRNDTPGANFYARLYYAFLRNCGVKNYPEHGFDLALMDRQFLPYLENTGKHINIPLFPFWLGFKPFYIDYERQTIPGKKSSWSFAKKFNLAIDSLLSFSRKPTRLLFMTGFTVSAASLLYAVFIIVSALLGRITVPGFATIMVLMSLFNGLTMIFLGIICEYLWRIFDEVNGHPASVIDEVLAVPGKHED